MSFKRKICTELFKIFLFLRDTAIDNIFTVVAIGNVGVVILYTGLDIFRFHF